MAYQLSIDIGNSRTKFGLFEERELLQQKTLANQDLEANHKLFDEYDLSAIIVSSVNKEAEEKLNLAKKAAFLLYLNHLTPLPFSIRYQSPETLGKDRIAAIAGAQTIYPKQNVLVLDVGTCVTYDFIDHAGDYFGGAISPGVQMRLKAMHHYTNQLPLLAWDQTKPDLLGKTTVSSMLSGAVNGMVSEMKGFIEEYNRAHEKLQLIITGGDAKLFEKELKNGIFADPNLVLKGLNEILIYNCE
ncbi:MAG: type III pantothenate kinase [Vicingaceae bacterium]